MNNAYIELDRRFEKYQSDENPESLAQSSYLAGFFGHEHGIDWDELLRHRLVVVLGEPGSGKTEELRAQHARLSASSFFLELNRLVKEEVSGILGEDENRRFSKWKNGSDEATFFLDAVDESKILRNDDFFTALKRVSKAIGPAMVRSRFVISSRISEWRPEIDRAEVLQHFGIDSTENEIEETKTNKQPIGRNSPRNTATKQKEGEDQAPAILVVTLLPLMSSQVERYASAKGVKGSQKFIAALEENNAWAFAGRPLDIEFLYTYWNDKGHLGNLTDLSEYMIDRLLAEVPNREKEDALKPEQAHEGAELLAAAVVFCRRLKFRVSDASGITGENLLSPADILPETWLPKERYAMMDRALFDAASHGAMSFHHRYHSDYLAAAWIARLMNGTCTLGALENLLFATLNGQRVMRPSLKPVAAWLITEGDEPWRRMLAEWILNSCPEIHLVHGDPAALPLEYRRKILGKLIEHYQGRHQVNLSMDRSALVRFANAGLTDEINRYLLDKTIAEDLRADLLMIVRAGKMSACIPTALAIFADPSTSDNLRSYAATVIRDAGDESHRRQLAQLWQGLPEISNALLAHLCEALFPHVIGAPGLLALIGRSGAVPRHSTDLPYYLGTLLKADLSASHAQELLDGILVLLSTPPLMNKPELSEKFYWVASLIPVCLQRLLVMQNLSSTAQDLAISAIFVMEKVERHGDAYRSGSTDKDEPSIQQLLLAHIGLRRKLFWERVAKFRHKNEKEPSVHQLNGYGTLVELTEADQNWLLDDAGGGLSLADRRLALEVAAEKLWSDRHPLLHSVWVLSRQTKGNSELMAVCRQYALARMKAPFMRVWYRHFRHKLLERYWWDNKL